MHHIAPPAGRVCGAMANLLSWLGGTNGHPSIASSVFHCEFEFIHPFEDGNGCMGRLWQTLVLTRWLPAFPWRVRSTPARSATARPFRRVPPGASAPRASSSCWRRFSKPSRPPGTTPAFRPQGGDAGARDSSGPRPERSQVVPATISAARHGAGLRGDDHPGVTDGAKPEIQAHGKRPGNGAGTHMTAA